MSQFAYLLALLGTICCFVLIDYRYKLVFFYEFKKSLLAIAFGVGFFLVWDLVGVKNRIFRQGSSKWQLDFSILPEVPIEELFFLFHLCYLSLILWRLGQKWLG